MFRADALNGFTHFTRNSAFNSRTRSPSPSRFSASRWNVEFRPILGVTIGRWQFLTNPIVGMGIGGHQKDSFLPANRIFYRVNDDLALGIETYSDMGSFGHFGKLSQQRHSVFLAADFTVLGLDMNLGVGHGVTAASEHWMVKGIVGVSF